MLHQLKNIMLFYQRERFTFLRAFLFVSFLVLISKALFLFGSYFPTRDSLHYHANSFAFFANSLWLQGSLPTLFPAGGGVPYALSSMSFGLTMPYKLLPSIFFDDIYFAWKVSFILGLLLFLFGLFALLYRETKNPAISVIICSFVLFSGLGSSFHQEQVLYTIFFSPYLFLIITSFFETPTIKKALCLGSLLGMMTFIHFPQIQVIIAIGAFFYYRDQLYLYFCNRDKNFKKHIFMILLSFALFAMPAYYFFIFFDDLILPQRIFESFNNQQYSFSDIDIKTRWQGVNGLYFCNYTLDTHLTDSFTYLRCFIDSVIFNFGILWDDSASLYIGPVFLFLVFTIFLKDFFQKKFSFLPDYIFLLFLFTLFYGPAENILSLPSKVLQIVFLDFRQWYHFFPVLLFFSCLLLGRSLSCNFKTSEKIRVKILQKPIILVFGVVLTFFLSPNFLEINTQNSRPLKFVQHSRQMTWHNPNLLSFNSRSLICKSSLERVEPYQFHNDAVIGLKTLTYASDSKIINNNIDCINPNDLLSFSPEVDKLLIRSDFVSPGSASAVSEISFDNLKQSSEVFKTAEIDRAVVFHLNGNLHVLGKVIAKNLKPLDIYFEYNKKLTSCDKKNINTSEFEIKCTVPYSLITSQFFSLEKIRVVAVEDRSFQNVPFSNDLQARDHIGFEKTILDFDGQSYNFTFGGLDKSVHLFLNPENNFAIAPDTATIAGSNTLPLVTINRRNLEVTSISLTVSPIHQIMGYFVFLQSFVGIIIIIFSLVDTSFLLGSSAPRSKTGKG